MNYSFGCGGDLGTGKAFSLTGYLFALFSVQSKELFQFANDLYVTGSTPGWGNLQLWNPAHE